MSGQGSSRCNAGSSTWEDERVARGMQRMLALRSSHLEDGEERPIGWKLAFGSPQALANLGIAAPVVGFLTDRTMVASPAVLPLGGTTRPAIEPEIAIYLGADLRAGSTVEEARAAISALGPAIEFVDITLPLDDLEGALAANVFHRGLLLGQRDSARAGGRTEGLPARVRIDGVETAVTDLEALTGHLADLIRHVADLLGPAGEYLREGDVVISGSITPLVWVDIGSEVTYQLGDLGELEVSFTEVGS
jgi:2-keto-4-pentenoate hydratase